MTMGNGDRDAGALPGGVPADAGDAGGGGNAGRDAGQRADGGSTADAGAADAGTTVKRTLQLTFDDGPEPVKSALTPILKEVKARGVVAAFFVIGEEVKTSRSAVVTIRDAGHIVGNHSWDHMEKGTSTFTDDQIYEEFESTHAEVKKAGITMDYWRAPRGDEIPRIQQILTAPKPPRKQLYSKRHSDWHASSNDAKGANTAEAMLASIERDFKDPKIPALRLKGTRVWRLLFHVKDSTAQALADVLDALQAQGGSFVDFEQDS
jgi:peptidoglycan/xylan/chitin deacetylase (PgdA/CDA1 family)